MSEFNLSLKVSVLLWLSRWVKCAAFHTGIKKQSAGIVSIILKYIVLLLSLGFKYEDSAWEQVGCIFSQKEIT